MDNIVWAPPPSHSLNKQSLISQMNCSSCGQNVIMQWLSKEKIKYSFQMSSWFYRAKPNFPPKQIKISLILYASVRDISKVHTSTNAHLSNVHCSKAVNFVHYVWILAEKVYLICQSFYIHTEYLNLSNGISSLLLRVDAVPTFHFD